VDYSSYRNGPAEEFPVPRDGRNGERTTPGPTDSEPSIRYIAWTIDRMLESVRDHLQVDVTYLSRLTESEQIVEVATGAAEELGLTPGTRIPLEETYCPQMVVGDAPAIVHDIDTDRNEAGGVLVSAGIRSYVGVAVRLADGRLHGTLCCVSSSPDPTLSLRDVQFLKAIAQIIADQIDQAEELRSDWDSRVDQVRRYVGGEGLDVRFQPIVDLRDGRVIGAEALARFDDGAPPLTWFAEAARIGLGTDLERTAARLALRCAEGLPDGTYVSINTSPGFLMEGALQELVDRFPGPRLVLEVTEHAAISDYPAVRTAVEPLLDRGARLAVDDAGSGFASFRHVVQLSPDILKLDRLLVRDIGSDPIQHALAETLTAFAERIGSTVTAEGIEDAPAVVALRQLGVTHGQGYHFARPTTLPLATCRYPVS
jgi:EAL domain-containing protein (putative c-di-GMP-specific phosphodiesterase class I)